MEAKAPCGHRPAARRDHLHPQRNRDLGRRGAFQHRAHRTGTKKRPACGHRYYKWQLCLRDTGVCSGALGTGYLQHADGQRPCAGMQAFQRGFPRRAPAKRDRKKPVPRGCWASGAAPGRIPALPARWRPVRVHLLYVPRRSGGGLCQRGRACCDQRHELPRPQRQKRQCGGGGQRRRGRFCQRSPPRHRLPARAGSKSLRRRSCRRGLRCPGRERAKLSGGARAAAYWQRTAYLRPRRDCRRSGRTAARGTGRHPAGGSARLRAQDRGLHCAGCDPDRP